MEEVRVKTSINLRNSYYNHLKIYTEQAGMCRSWYTTPEIQNKHLQKFFLTSYLYTAEIVAAIFTLQWVEEVRPDRVVLYTDSLAVIKSIQSMTSVREDLLIELYHSLLKLHRGGTDVQFCWVLAHEGVEGNEGACGQTSERSVTKGNNSSNSTWKWKGKSSG